MMPAATIPEGGQAVADRREDCAKIILVGCGRSHRRDDQAGLIAARRLSANLPPGVSIVETEAPAIDMLNHAASAQLLIIVDSALAGGPMPPGAWKKFVWSRLEAPGEQDHEEPLHLAGSSHLLGVFDMLRLGRELSLLPPDIWIYAVAASDFGYGNGLSRPVETGVRQMVQCIQADVEAWLAARDVCHA